METLTTTPRTNLSGKPIETWRSGPITVSLFENAGKHGKFHSVSLQRYYRAGKETRRTSTLRPADLRTASQLLEETHAYLAGTVKNAEAEE